MTRPENRVGKFLSSPLNSAADFASQPVDTRQENVGYMVAKKTLMNIAFKNAGLELDITLSAADTDVIKTYVRLGMGAGLITAMAYDALIDQDLVVRDLAHLIPSSNTKIAYLKHNYLPLYSQHFIEELLIAADEITAWLSI